MNSWHSYPKVWAIGHESVKEIFEDEVHVEEKVDGSQFSFGAFATDEGVELRARSKGKEIVIDAPEKMFNKAIGTAKELFGSLHLDWTYRGEYLQGPKHNVLAYDRSPKANIIIFDINTHHEGYLDYHAKKAECERIGLECVPLLYQGKVDSPAQLIDLLEAVSCLGGQKIEGFVAKNYKRFGKDGKALLGKFVSEAFKEIHGKTWRSDNPLQGDIVETLIGKLKTEARWDKAIIHLKERGELECSPRDIGKLINEVRADIEGECKPEIIEMLYAWAWPKVQRGLVGGLPEYYKKKLLQSQFDQESA